MKPILRKIDTGHQHSFSVREDIYPFLYNHWHYHPEIELTLIRKGTGTRLVGSSIEQFTNGDLILLGSELPHLWRSDTQYFEGRRDLHIEAIAIHFKEDCWGNEFLKMPELKPVKTLLNLAKRGVKITGETRKQVLPRMEAMLHASEAQRVIGLIDILYLVASSVDYSFLSSTAFTKETDSPVNDKIDAIYNYTLSHFNRRITLQEIATAVDINAHSFCRYFKTRTQKTYWQFLLEVRVGHACKLLVERKMNIVDISQACGFNNLSNFNRQFKALIHLTPMQYAKSFIPAKL